MIIHNLVCTVIKNLKGGIIFNDITECTPQYCRMLYFLLNKVVEHKGVTQLGSHKIRNAGNQKKPRFTNKGV